MPKIAPRFIGIGLLLLLSSLFLAQSCAFQNTKSSVSWTRSTSRSLLFAAVGRSIAIFDQDDFSLPTGEWPYSKADLMRLDNSVDTNFYSEPRFVTHIDDQAIAALTAYYAQEFRAAGKESIDFLDLCSSWISHLPNDADIKYGRVAGVGMNQKELEANAQLTEFAVQDLNENPVLPYEDNSFDFIGNVVSVDYLTKPREIFKEMHRVLRPNGVALMSFSNRCFPSKAVAMWLQADDIGRMTIVASYYHYSANFGKLEALDILPEKQALPETPSVSEIFKNPGKGLAWMNAAAAVQKTNAGDPMYVVKAVK